MDFLIRAFRSRIRLVFPFLMLAAAAIPLAAEPTGEREWTSTAGTRLTAVAMAVEGASVRFISAGGKETVVPLAKLAAEDREFLRKHFGIAEEPSANAASAVQGKSAPLSTQLPHPVGEVSGPHEAGNGSHFFIYIPKTLKHITCWVEPQTTTAISARMRQPRHAAADFTGSIRAVTPARRPGFSTRP